jgi:hypothetical protein
VVLLELVPGTLFLKTLDSSRHLAIPVELLESVPAPRIIPGHSLLNSKPNNSLLLGLKNQRLTISDQPCGFIGTWSSRCAPL